ncbi:acyltransferase [Mucilaginibacter pallidiroseus]|uniref:Acyltransferase n=1 Tax=Mucilaginibacter pallidiroseus TaxID=2599295 RepID=A0A563UGU1_9SPHI|nr:acyltransferase [Mucilaginibacter pallidiroseus]TWR30620.1 acyltransferase [Mucilaginibacter pallidiroseus]
MPVKQNRVIDILRFFAACGVALFHFQQPVKHLDDFYRAFCHELRLGVPVFFVISGYCISISLNQSKTPNNFIIRRLFRIFPAYWLSLVIVGVVVIYAKIAHGENDVAVLPKTIKDIIATLTLTTTPFSEILTVNWVYWSLTCELFFYFIIYCIAFLPVKFRLPAISTICVLSVLLPFQNSGYLFFLDHWPAFAFGIAIYYLVYQKHRSLIPIIIAALSMAHILMHRDMIYLGVCITTGLLIIAGEYYPIKKNSLSVLGNYSYAIYLIHVPLGVYVAKDFVNIFVYKYLYLNILVDLLTLLFVALLSKLIYKYVERPFIDLGNKLSS